MNKSPWQAAALLLALTACVAPSADKPVAVAEVAPETAAPAPDTVTVVIEQPPAPEPVVIEEETEIVIEQVIAALPPPEEPIPATPEPAPEPVIDDDPEQLMGLVDGALADLLGEPVFFREEADAQVWQYRGLDCLLDVYLYSDGDGTPHRVTYYEFRGDGEDRPCLRDLLRGQAG